MESLAVKLLNTGDDTPIIFAAWDIGGSIVKEALLIASSSPKAFEAAIIKRTTTLLFFGTPHTCAAPENWEAVLLTMSCRLSGGTSGNWLPQFVSQMADYHRSLEARFHRFSHSYKIVQYIQGSGDADFTKHVASLNCDKEEFVTRNGPLNQATALLEAEVQQQLQVWLNESRTVLDRSFQELMYEFNSKSEPLLEQSRVGSWMFMQTAEFCFQQEAARSWLLTKATCPLILRIPPLVDCRFMFNSIVSYIKDTTCSETAVTKYQVVFLDLYPLPATRTTTPESLLSTLIHRIVDEYPRFWDLPATVPINELVSLIRSNPPVSELTLWRVLKLILASLGDQSIVCLLRLSEIVDTNFKLAIVTTSGANIDIDLDTDVLVAQATADDISFKTAVRKDVLVCVHNFSAPNSTLSSSSQPDVWADFDPSSLVPSSLMAHLRYIQTCPRGMARRDITTSRLLSNVDNTFILTILFTEHL
ncbi:hypothetical protein F4825DRAFT_471469 [Nemania diffusa]|nr:hypothetical protein F4825DRAFT_471469 [Nemania diffusa]